MNSSDRSNQAALKNPELGHLCGRRAAVVVFSHYPSDPRPRREAEALIKEGMEVDVISIRQDDHDLQCENFNGVNILRVPLRHLRGGKASYFFQYGSFILAAFFLLAFRSFSRRYSLVHVHNMPDVLVFTALVPKLCGAKVILDLHDPMPELMTTIFGMEARSFGVSLLKCLEKWSIRFADMAITPNIAFAKLFSIRSGKPGKLLVVMNSPDEKIFEYRELVREKTVSRDPIKPFVIMYHGALVERHGLDDAVRALEKIRVFIPGAELRIYGRATPYFHRVMEEVNARGLHESVRYLGAKSLEQIVEAIDNCDVGIIPNRRSVFTELNMPTRIFEYLARSKPVIVPRTVGIRDYFSQDETVFFEPGDVNDLMQKLRYVFLQPLETNEIVKRGQAVYRAHKWSEERMSLVNLVGELLNDGKSRCSVIQPSVTVGKP